MTREEAVEQIGALTRDRDFIKRYFSGDLEATAKIKTLHAAARRSGGRPFGTPCGSTARASRK
jgi:hypothetical protein